jgi:stage VI sporulation protein D
MTENNSSLTFSVVESVWFKKGQEVQEVLSMSLEPEISIEERSNEISIKGALQLIGEYVPRKNSTSEEDEQSIYAETRGREVEDVTISEDGVGELTHRFPVDISVPITRVRNLDDIYVVIDSFDYDLPEHGCLKLSADIVISGIEHERASESVQEHVYEQHHYEVQEQQQYENAETRNDFNNYDSAPADQTNEDYFEVETRKAPEANDYDETEYSNEVETYQQQTPQVEMKGRVEEDSTNQEEEHTYWNNEVSIGSHDNSYRYASNEEEEEVTNEQQSSRDENALYLTKMLAGEEEERQFTSLKMCIAQQGDSLQEIADRYHCSVSQIMRVNRLDNEEISEGQIIYIPSSVQKI